MSHKRNILLTGGTHNRILCSHEDLCHHCGYIGGGPTSNRCTECGRQTHPGCVPPFRDGVCDACRHSSDEEGACVCEVCHVTHSDEREPPDGVDRLVDLIVFHGRRWSPGAEDGRGERVCLPEECEVAQRLAIDASATFTPSQLPEGMGGEPMRVMVDGVHYLSRPMVVHSWCVQSAFQFHPAPTGSPAWQDVVDAIDAKRRSEFAEVSTQLKLGAINTVAGCAFCNSSEGFQIFCYGHTNSKRGCSNCNWHIRPSFSYTSFHPSCAVRAGMYRMTDPVDGGCGMMCRRSMTAILPKVHKLQRTRETTTRILRVERWLEQSSGFHMILAARIDPITLTMDISPTRPVVGARYDAFPIVRRRVVHKRHRAECSSRRGAEVVDDVAHEPRDETHQTHATSDAVRQYRHDGHAQQPDQGHEQGAHTDEAPNETVTHSSSRSSSMTLEESSELIRRWANPRMLEAIDVRIEWAVRRALMCEMEVREGIEACERL